MHCTMGFKSVLPLSKAPMQFGSGTRATIKRDHPLPILEESDEVVQSDLQNLNSCGIFVIKLEVR